MRRLKIVSMVLLLLIAVCAVAAWQFASGHFPERGPAYQARMVYLPIAESEKANTADNVWPWPFSRFYNVFFRNGTVSFNLSGRGSKADRRGAYFAGWGLLFSV